MSGGAVSPLVERVARSIWEYYAEQRRHLVPTVGWDDLLPDWKDVERLRARIAIDACHAEEMVEALRDLLEDTQHRDHDCGDTPEDCPVLRARALLAKVEGRS